VKASSRPTLDLDLFEALEPESTLLKRDLSAGLLAFLTVFLSPLRKASMAFLRTVVMVFFDLKSAGFSAVMKISPPLLAGSSLAGAAGLCDVFRLGRAMPLIVSNYSDPSLSLSLSRP
jgi:hypothetical protein